MSRKRLAQMHKVWQTIQERPKKRFKCSQCGEIVEAVYDIGGGYHNVIPSAKCDGTGSLYEITDKGENE